MTAEPNRRVLVVDDNRAIHDDFRKILAPRGRDDELSSLEAELFGEPSVAGHDNNFVLTSAFQGEEALQLVRAANARHEPFALAFMDVRMPPGWDGIETTEKLLKEDDSLQVVICTAYSDHDWDDVAARLGPTDRVLILKKPFDMVEVRQLAHALRHKWELVQLAKEQMAALEARVAERTRALHDANTQLRHEMTERERMETELRLAQKLEAVGQLAAGIAHEINTPIQYVGDNTAFLQSAFDDLLALIDDYQAARGDCEAQVPDVAARMLEAELRADVAFLRDNVPPAFSEALDGIKRVTEIVRAMKEFAHPDQRDKADADLNQAIRSTLVVARNEYKLIADINVDLPELPPVLCHVGDINQVILNLVVNAAHAIGDKVAGTSDKGLITVKSRLDGDHVEIAIGDSGGGIPESIRSRVFDPFFTTKEVGRGTGQGLAIARSIVVDKHRGDLRFDSEAGKGTTFYVRLPLKG
jgi:signal transduction histidine kinase